VVLIQRVQHVARDPVLLKALGVLTQAQLAEPVANILGAPRGDVGLGVEAAVLLEPLEAGAHKSGPDTKVHSRGFMRQGQGVHSRVLSRERMKNAY
jgi:hypothetical protein